MSYPTAVQEPIMVKCFAQTGNAIKRQMIKGFELLGEKIVILWQNSLPYLRFAGWRIVEFLRTAAGVSLMTGLIGVILQVSAETATQCNKHARLALRILAGTAFFSTGFTIGLGLAYGFNITLI